MTENFKKGLFLHITSKDTRQWEKDIKSLSNFKRLDFVEIWVEEINLEVAEIKWLKEALSDYEIVLHAPFINLSLVSSHDSINSASVLILKKTVDLAVSIGAKLITVHGGSYPLFQELADTEKRFVKNFNDLMNYAKGKVIISVENTSVQKTTQISYPTHLNDLDRIKPSIPTIKFTLDIGHCIQNGDDYVNFIKLNNDQITNIHLHNAIRGGSAHYGFQRDGGLNLSEVISVLREIHYSKYLSLEILENKDKIKSWDMLLGTLR